MNASFELFRNFIFVMFKEYISTIYSKYVCMYVWLRECSVVMFSVYFDGQEAN